MKAFLLSLALLVMLAATSFAHGSDPGCRPYRGYGYGKPYHGYGHYSPPRYPSPYHYYYGQPAPRGGGFYYDGRNWGYYGGYGW